MGQVKNKPKVIDGEARCYVKNIRTSPYKLALVARMIQGKPASKALVDLEFSKRRVAQHVKKALESAIANAENNSNLDIDRLIVKEASVGKSLVMKRFRARAKGRGARILKPFSNLTIIVQEREEIE